MKRSGLPYEIHETASSIQIRNSEYRFITSSCQLGLPILGHLNSCKIEILKNAKEKNLLIPSRVRWYKVGEFFIEPERLPGKMFVNEFDLNHAYWVVAYRLGFIGKKTYEKFLGFKTKFFRLLALGMLAKREHVRRFDCFGKQIDSSVIVSETGVQIFRRIAFEVASEMERLSKLHEQEFRFFWCDNIIFDTTIRKLETSFTYKFSTELLELVYKPQHQIFLDLSGRPFSFSRTEALGERLGYEVPF